MEDAQRAQELLSHLLSPLLNHPEAMEVNIIEGSATVIVEMRVHEEDRSVLNEEDGVLRNVQHLLTIASSERKFSLELLTD